MTTDYGPRTTDNLLQMTNDIIYNLRDNGGRRSGIDRRRFNYSGHFPERRSGIERRSGLDRRLGEERRSGWMRGGVVEMKRHVDQKDVPDRRSGADRRDFTIL
jgi:hypothetical protein